MKNKILKLIEDKNWKYFPEKDLQLKKSHNTNLIIKSINLFTMFLAPEVLYNRNGFYKIKNEK